MGATQRPTRRLVEHKLAFAWLLSFFTGVLAILGVSYQWGILVAVLVLILYTIYGAQYERKNTTKFADSIYFMGFLWTLTALIQAVIIKETPTASSVFKAFGYALIATGAGMFLRLLLIQFQETLPDRLIEAQEDIDKRVAAFTDQLQKATSDIDRFRQTARQGLEERLTGLTISLMQIQAEIEAGHRTASQMSIEALGAAVVAFQERLDRFQVSDERMKSEIAKLNSQFAKGAEKLGMVILKMEGRFTDSANALVSASQSLSDRLNQVDIPSDLFTRQVAVVTHQVEEGVGSLIRAIEGAAPALDRSIRQLGASLAEVPGRADVEAALKGMAQTLRGISNQQQASLAGFQAIAERIGKVATELAGLGDTLAKFRQSVDGLQTQAGRLSSQGMATVIQHVADAERVIAEARRAGAELHAAVSEVLQFIRRRLEAQGLP